MHEIQLGIFPRLPVRVVGLFCRSLASVKVIGSEGTPAVLWHQVSSLPPHALLGTGSHWPRWRALPGDLGPACAHLSGLSGGVQTVLGKSVRKWALGRLCRAGWESRGGGHTACESAGLCRGLPPLHMTFSEAHLTPGLGVGPPGQQMQIPETPLSGFKSHLPHIQP